jgi:hypothetical protein
MAIKYDIGLSDGKNKKFVLSLDGDNAIQETSLSEDQFAAYIRSVGKKFGDFDEQRNWKGGRGVEYFNDNPDGFFDSKDCWTMSTGSLMPTIQHKFARDLRYENTWLPGSVKWKALYGETNNAVAVSFVPTANYSAAQVWMWIRKVGNPPDLTIEIRSAGSGIPTPEILKAVTVSSSTITDISSVYHKFTLASVLAVTSGTTYWLVTYGSFTSNAANHWEVGTGVASGLEGTYDWHEGEVWAASLYAPYYRVSDANPDGVFYPFIYDSAMYVVFAKDSKASSLLFINGDRGKASAGASTTITDASKSWDVNKWAGAYVRIVRGTGIGQTRIIASNTSTALTVSAWTTNPDNTSVYIIYATDRFTLIGTTGLGHVTSTPCISNDIVYFPQGATVVRKMTWLDASAEHSFANEGSSTKFYYMITGNDVTDGPLVIGSCSTYYEIQKAHAVSWGTDLTLETAIKVGSSQYKITNLCAHNGLTYIFKEDSVWHEKSDKVYEEPFGIGATPEEHNGQAAVSHNLFLYFSWLWSTERLFGTTLDDIGQDWGGIGLPEDRQGFVTKYEPAVGWLFAAIDAGNGTSSVLCYDGMAWHEVLRSRAANRRIRNIKWQPCPGTRHRLWTSVGSDLVYQVFPLNTANPLNDSSVNYEHEAILTSSTIDMGAASRLPKYIKGLTLMTKNLSDSGMSVELDYQVDNNIGSTSWINVTPGFLESPEQELTLNESDIRQFRYRLRLITDTSTKPVVVKSVVPSGYARVPWRRVWHIRIKTGEIFDSSGRKSVPADKLKDFLRDNARNPGIVKMTSKYKDMNNVYVISSPPTNVPQSTTSDVMTLSLLEI